MTTVKTPPLNSPREWPPLASAGGPKALSMSASERWKSVRLRDLVPIARLVKWGMVTDPEGSGPTGEFEREFAQLIGTKYALAMNSGTAALHSALFAVGVGPNDEVILPSYTWHATAGAVKCCGATPVFCDIDPNTLTADPVDIAGRITPRTKAILVVHVWGNPCRMDEIRKIADEHGLALVEDCSHAHGAVYQGRAIGAWGDIGCFSLQGGKAVSAGEGGIAVCSQEIFQDRMLALGHPVRKRPGSSGGATELAGISLGPKYRPHVFAVAWARRSLARLNQLNARRRNNWEILCSALEGCNTVRPVDTLSGAIRGGFLEFKFVLELPDSPLTNVQIAKALKSEGAPFSADRYGSLHLVPYFRRGGGLTASLLDVSDKLETACGELPNTEAMRGRVLTLPAFIDVPERYLLECAAALIKVTHHANRSTQGF